MSVITLNVIKDKSVNPLNNVDNNIINNDNNYNNNNNNNKDIKSPRLLRTKSRNKSMDNFMKYQWGWSV